jgi:predicted GNAT superfamily acetyltransferase
VTRTPTELSIRAVLATDFSAIRVINADASPGVSIFAPSHLERVLAEAMVAWVAAVGDAVVGYLIAYAAGATYDGDEFNWFQSRSRDFMYIDQVAVAASFRRRGIGNAFYDAVEARAAREGLASLVCEVNETPPNPGSMAFHLRRGFVRVDGLSTSDGRVVALLSKQLRIAV